MAPIDKTTTTTPLSILCVVVFCEVAKSYRVPSNSLVGRYARGVPPVYDHVGVSFFPAVDTTNSNRTGFRLFGSAASVSLHPMLGDVTFSYNNPNPRVKENFFFPHKNVKVSEDLEFTIRRAYGRCSLTGHIVSRHRGGGIKEPYKMIDWWFFNYGKQCKSALIVQILPRPWQPYPIALVMYVNSLNRFAYRYILVGTNGLQVGDFVNAGCEDQIFFKEGNSKPIQSLPLHTTIYNLEDTPGSGAAIARNSKLFAKIINRNPPLDDDDQHKNRPKRLLVQLPSGQEKYFDGRCFATIGVTRENVIIPKKRKAGVNRNLGRRPHVRGSAMNPVDHPHGGGTGRCTIGRINQMTPWGKFFKGMKLFGKDMGRGPTRRNRNAKNTTTPTKKNKNRPLPVLH